MTFSTYLKIVRIYILHIKQMVSHTYYVLISNTDIYLFFAIYSHPRFRLNNTTSNLLSKLVTLMLFLKSEISNLIHKQQQILLEFIKVNKSFHEHLERSFLF